MVVLRRLYQRLGSQIQALVLVQPKRQVHFADRFRHRFHLGGYYIITVLALDGCQATGGPETWQGGLPTTDGHATRGTNVIGVVHSKRLVGSSIL